MKKKALSLLLTLALCLSLLPTAAWATEDTQAPAEQAEETGIAVQADHQDHPVCGVPADCVDPDHSDDHGTIDDWQAINNQAELEAAVANGHYYLATNVDIDKTWQPKSGVVLCLNGNTLKAKGDFDVIDIDKTTFTLTDCKTTGEVTHDAEKTGRGVYNGYGKFNMYGGSITGNT